jgi:cytosine/creatinine deaminase
MICLQNYYDEIQTSHLLLAAQDWVMSDQEADEFMRAAIAQARKSREEGGIPIGSALARAGELIAVGHNKRVQENDPVTHAEIDCLRSAGRVGSFRDTVLYSTLMPCYLCAGAVVQFGIKKVIVGESRTFSGALDFMRSHGVEVIDLDLPECVEMMQKFIAENPALWNEDIGK